MKSSSAATARTAFRVVAFAEALSWLGLLIGMYVKYVPETTEAGVQIFGMIHGIVFIAYLVCTIWAARALRWSPLVTLLALASSIPPFFTAIFEVIADRKGLLDTGRATSDAEVREPATDLTD